MVHQTFVWWALCILLKLVRSLIRHLGSTIGEVWHVRWFLWTLLYIDTEGSNWLNGQLSDSVSHCHMIGWLLMWLFNVTEKSFPINISTFPNTSWNGCMLLLLFWHVCVKSVVSPVIKWSILSKIFTQTPHPLLLKGRYVGWFVSLKSNPCFLLSFKCFEQYHIISFHIPYHSKS